MKQAPRVAAHRGAAGAARSAPNAARRGPVGRPHGPPPPPRRWRCPGRRCHYLRVEWGATGGLGKWHRRRGPVRSPYATLHSAGWGGGRWAPLPLKLAVPKMPKPDCMRPGPAWAARADGSGGVGGFAHCVRRGLGSGASTTDGAPLLTSPPLRSAKRSGATCAPLAIARCWGADSGAAHKAESPTRAPIDQCCLCAGPPQPATPLGLN